MACDMAAGHHVLQACFLEGIARRSKAAQRALSDRSQSAAIVGSCKPASYEKNCRVVAARPARQTPSQGLCCPILWGL
eukprot:350071-Chlamydomonas_euryale.AAC.2